MSSSAFDELACSYDDEFTQSSIGRLMRSAVWRHCDEVFEPGERVLEVGCGTGEDALHLARRGVEVLATDASREMTEAAQHKLNSAGLSHLAAVQQLEMANLDRLEPQAFDGILSNFGPLNCAADLSAVAASMDRRLRPRGRLLLCVMGPWVPWEWVWYCLRGRPRTAFRRLRRAGSPWRGMTIRYPSIRELRSHFGTGYECRRLAAIGALIPPSYAEAWASRHPKLLATLDRLERRWESTWPLPRLADHYLIELQRRPDRE